MLQILGKTDKLGVTWTIRKVIDNYKMGVTVFDNAVQRGLVWDNERKSRLMRSTLLDRPIPPIYASKHDEIYSNLDGKQRSHAWVEFVNNEFALEGLDPISVRDSETGEIRDININGMHYGDLPEEFQNAILDSTITVIVMNNATEDEECEIFFDINNGKPLNAITVTRVKAKSRKEITDVGNHEIFHNALTKKALEAYTNEDIVVKSWAMLHEEEPNLETKHIRPLMRDVVFTEDDVRQLNACFDRIMEVHSLIDDKKIAKRLLGRTHLISIMPLVWKSIQEGVSAKKFMVWFIGFFAGKRRATISNVYNDNARNGSNRSSSIRNRLNELTTNYDAFIRQNTDMGEYKEVEEGINHEDTQQIA
jgi:conserved hypothetical protein